MIIVSEAAVQLWTRLEQQAQQCSCQLVVLREAVSELAPVVEPAQGLLWCHWPVA